jgi:4-amino-4-deoxy-L-arabinose transferase-like glycosyltransferase
MIFLVITLLSVPWLLFCVIALWVWHRAAQNSDREP